MWRRVWTTGGGCLSANCRSVDGGMRCQPQETLSQRMGCVCPEHMATGHPKPWQAYSSPAERSVSPTVDARRAAAEVRRVVAALRAGAEVRRVLEAQRASAARQHMSPRLRDTH